MTTWGDGWRWSGRARLGLVVVALGAGCGDNTAAPPAVTSGTRLKLGWYEYTDGTRQLRDGDLFDAELGARCRVRLSVDAVLRCAPDTVGGPESQLAVLASRVVALTSLVTEQAYTSDDGLYLPVAMVETELDASCSMRSISAEAVACPPSGFGGTVVYRDAACTEAALGEWPKVAVPRAVTAGPYCAPQAYAVGAPTGSTPRYYQDEAGACVDAPTTFTGFHELERRETLIFERIRVPSPGRRLEPVITMVGLREVPVELFDTALGEECAPARRPGSGSEVVCVPQNVARRVMTYYPDATCTVVAPFAVVDLGARTTSCTRTPSFVRALSGAPTLFQRLGPAVAAYELVAGGCRLVADPSIAIHALGEPVPDDTWVHGLEVHDP